MCPYTVLLGSGPPAKQNSQVAETVFNVLGQSEVSITGLKEGTDSSIIQQMEMQKVGQVGFHKPTGT